MFGISRGFRGLGPQIGVDGLHSMRADPFLQSVGEFVRLATASDQDFRGQPATADAALRELPSIQVSQHDIEQNDNPDCVICLEPLVLGEQANRIPCGHLFHEHCIKDWLRTSNQCPVCRYELATDDARYEHERQSRTGCRRPRLRRLDLSAKSVRELRHLARHLGVSIADCIEKQDIAQRLAASGTIELVCDGAVPNRFAPANVPDSCKLSSTQLAHMSVSEIRRNMMQMGVDFTGCHEKRDLIQRLIAAGRVVVASPGASELVAPSDCSSASDLQGRSEVVGETLEVAFSEPEDGACIAVYGEDTNAERSHSYAEGSASAAKACACKQ